MSTTAIVTEILIVGVQTLIVLAVALVVIAGDRSLGEAIDGWRKSVVDWKDAIPLLAAFTVGAVYTLGIIVDRVADTFDDPLLKLARLEPAKHVRVRRMQVMHKSPEITKFLEYQRSRLRVGRATYVNLFLFLVLLAAVTFAGQARPGLPLLWIWLGSLLAFAGSVLVWLRMDRTFVSSLVTATSVIQKGERMPSIAAAVCYELQDGEPRFLLVKTKADTWTFPKGHVKRNESGDEAAAREAREEAGVAGDIAGEPFTTYLYPKQSDEIDLVHAYLLEVSDKTDPKENWRKPKFFEVSEAMTKLAKSRGDWYAKQMAGVVALAQARLKHPDSAARTHPAGGKTDA